MKYFSQLIIIMVAIVAPVIDARAAEIELQCPILSRTLQPGTEGADVSRLQNYFLSLNYLNGDEVTGFYGKRTTSAVQRWQKERDLVSSGDPMSTGYGAVGPKTQLAFLQCALDGLLAQLAILKPVRSDKEPAKELVVSTTTSRKPVSRPRTPKTTTTPAVGDKTPSVSKVEHEHKIGIYYFGIWSQKMFDDSTWGVNNEPRPSVAKLPWWQGVEDFYSKTSSSYTLWNKRTPGFAVNHLKPSIGYYDNADVRVLEKHIAQANNASIDFFNFYWYWSPHDDTPAYDDGLNSFRKASNKQLMNFAINVYTSPWNPDFQIPTEDMGQAAEALAEVMSDPAYLRVDNRPVLYLGDMKGLGQGTNAELNSFIVQVKNATRARGSKEPYIIIKPGVTANWQTASGDAYSCLFPTLTGFRGGDSYKNFVSRIDSFYADMAQYGKPIAPCAAANLDERPRQFFEPKPEDLRYFTDFTPGEFYRGLGKVRDWQARQTHPLSKVLTIYAWNEWQEGGIIEPNVRDGDLMLDLIERAFRTTVLVRYTSDKVSTGHRTSSDGLISPWKKEGAWRLFTSQNNASTRIPLYECLTSSGRYYVSTSSSCDGNIQQQRLGYLAANEKEAVGLVPLYQCILGEDRYVSQSPTCESSSTVKSITEKLLGYVYPSY